MGCIIYPALISTDKKEKKRNVLVRQLSDTFEVCETLLSARSLVHIKLGLTVPSSSRSDNESVQLPFHISLYEGESYTLLPQWTLETPFQNSVFAISINKHFKMILNIS